VAGQGREERRGEEREREKGRERVIPEVLFPHFEPCFRSK